MTTTTAAEASAVDAAAAAVLTAKQSPHTVTKHLTKWHQPVTITIQAYQTNGLPVTTYTRFIHNII